MAKPQWKVGDWVTPAKGRYHEYVTPGKAYQVVKVSDNYTWVGHDRGSEDGWNHAFWTVAPPPSLMEPDMSLDEIFEGQEIYAKLNGG